MLAEAQCPSAPWAPDWTGETVVCVASGPSLLQRDVDYCKGLARVAVVNDCFHMAPWADMLYAGDADWWHHHWDRGASEFRGIKVSQDKKGEVSFIEPGVNLVRGDPGYTLCHTPWAVHWGGNSGFQLIQVAYHCGARRLLLLGYDMQRGPNGERHWFGDHPHGTGLHKDSPYWMWKQAFKVASQQTHDMRLTIINCSRETAIEEIPRGNLRKILI